MKKTNLILVILCLVELVIIVLFLFSRCDNVEKPVAITNSITNSTTNRVWKTNEVYVFASETNYLTNIVFSSELVERTIEKKIFLTNFLTNHVNKDFFVSLGGGVSVNGIVWQVSVHKSIWNNIYGGITIQNNGILVNVSISF